MPPMPPDGPEEGFAAPRLADPGSPGARRIALLIAVFVYTLLTLVSLLVPQTETHPAALPETVDEAWAPPQPQFDMASKLQVASKEWLSDGVASGLGDVTSMAGTPEDLVRAAIVEAEVFGAEAGKKALRDAAETLEDLAKREDEPSRVGMVLPRLQEDIAVLQKVYDEGSWAITGPERQGLIDRHGWYAELALRWDAEAQDEARLKVVREGRKPLMMILGVVIVGLGLGLIGLTMVITLAVRASQGQMRPAFRAPAPGGSVYLEIFAAFLVAFLLLQFVQVIVVSLMGEKSMGLAAALQWSLLGVAAWPLLRGVSWERTRTDLGLTSGGGVLKEIGCGVLGYIATIPALMLSFVVVLGLVKLVENTTGEAPAPNNPVMEQVSSGGVMTVVLLFTLAAIWAPLCEEIVFRGALFRHVRSRVMWPIAALLTAVIFAFMHSYGPIFTPPLIVLGFSFAWMREWRGSLIAPMTMHFIHNSALITLVLAMR